MRCSCLWSLCQLAVPHVQRLGCCSDASRGTFLLRIRRRPTRPMSESSEAGLLRLHWSNFFSLQLANCKAERRRPPLDLQVTAGAYRAKSSLAPCEYNFVLPERPGNNITQKHKHGHPAWTPCMGT